MPAGISGDELRALLRECCTVIAPGEVLALRFPGPLSEDDYREITARIDRWKADNGVAAPVLVLGGDVDVTAVAWPPP